MTLSFSDYCAVLDDSPESVIERANNMIAFCSRYGRADVRDWPRSEAMEFASALRSLLDSEHKLLPSED